MKLCITTVNVPAPPRPQPPQIADPETLALHPRPGIDPRAADHRGPAGQQPEPTQKVFRRIVRPRADTAERPQNCREVLPALWIGRDQVEDLLFGVDDEQRGRSGTRRVPELKSVARDRNPRRLLDPFPDIVLRDQAAVNAGPADVGLGLETDHAKCLDVVRVGDQPAHDLGDSVEVALGHGDGQRRMELDARTPVRGPDQVDERPPQRMEVGLALEALDREAGPAGLGDVDMDGDLAQTGIPHEPFEKGGVLEQDLAVGHQHRHDAGVGGVADDLDQFVRLVGTPVGIDHVATGDLQVSRLADQPAVGVDLLFHLVEYGQRHPVGVVGQVAVRASERTVGRSHEERTVGHLTPDSLAIGA